VVVSGPNAALAALTDAIAADDEDNLRGAYYRATRLEKNVPAEPEWGEWRGRVSTVRTMALLSKFAIGVLSGP
jgi:hypothetical protein